VTWTVRDIPDQSGRVALVTGVTGGIGFHTALELARNDAQVVLAGRNLTAVYQVADAIRTEVRGASVEPVRMDLADLGSIQEAAQQILHRWPLIDLLVNNAGVMATPFRRTSDGFELQMGTNHLGHFALTGRLLPALHSARVVTVSSFMHHHVNSLSDFEWRSGHRYRKWTAYSESKLANLLFMLELHRRAGSHHLDLVSVGAHPGYCSTALTRGGPQLGAPDLTTYLLRAVTRLFAQSAAAGARPVLMASTLRTIAGGSYLGPSGLFELRGGPQPVGMSRAARDPEVAAELWARSEEATGVRYP